MHPFPPEQRSLFGEILDWMLAPLLLLWPMSLALTYAVAQNIANRPYDRELGDKARTIARQIVVEPARDGGPGLVKLRLPEVAADVLRSDDTDRVYFHVVGARGEHVAGDRELFVPDDEPVIDEVRFRDGEIQSEPVRIAYLWIRGSGGRDETPPLVQVGETLEKRSQLATEIIKGVIIPQFIILPVAVVLVWFALARGIRPLHELQQRIRRRKSQDLSPIEERDAPEEVAPLVRAINDLLARLDQSISTQKHFLADAAHQLKTPLAGLRMSWRSARSTPASRTRERSNARCSRSRARASGRRTWSISCCRWRGPRTRRSHCASRRCDWTAWRARPCTTSFRRRWTSVSTSDTRDPRATRRRAA